MSRSCADGASVPLRRFVVIRAIAATTDGQCVRDLWLNECRSLRKNSTGRKRAIERKPWARARAFTKRLYRDPTAFHNAAVPAPCARRLECRLREANRFHWNRNTAQEERFRLLPSPLGSPCSCIAFATIAFRGGSVGRWRRAAQLSPGMTMEYPSGDS